MYKNFYFFGTSFSSGGGLGWDHNPEITSAKDHMNDLSKAYPDKIGLTELECSISADFEKILVAEGIEYRKVKNFAKPGYGLNRIVREIFKLVYNSEFTLSDSVLIIELTDNVGRRDIFYNKINDYIIGNNSADSRKIDDMNFVNTWFKDSLDTIEKLKKDSVTFKEFYKLTYKLEEELRKAENTTLMLISFLQIIGANFFFSSGPYYVDPHKLKLINFDKSKLVIENLRKFIRNNKLTIWDESNNTVNDRHHAGFKGSKIIAEVLFNHLTNKYSI